MRFASRACSSSAETRVALTRNEHGVATVALSRGNKMNALDMSMFRAIAGVARELIGDRSVRAVVLHGEGPAFCAGIDIRAVISPPNTKKNLTELLERPKDAISNLAQDVSYLWRRVPVPVIAVTHGVCFGGGLQIALGADIRVTSPTCKFSVMEANWGLIPDMGATVVFPELIPKDVAMELAMTGRVFKAPEALKLGLVTRIADDPLAEATRLAREISTRSPDATAANKRLLNATYSSKDDGRSLAIETSLQRQLIGRWNQVAMSAKGFGLPTILQPGFLQRSTMWSKEADDKAEQEIISMLDGKTSR